MVTLTSGIMFLLFTCMHFWVWKILLMWSVCAPTAFEVVRDCRMFENTSPGDLTQAVAVQLPVLSETIAISLETDTL